MGHHIAYETHILIFSRIFPGSLCKIHLRGMERRSQLNLVSRAKPTQANPKQATRRYSIGTGTLADVPVHRRRRHRLASQFTSAPSSPLSPTTTQRNRPHRQRHRTAATLKRAETASTKHLSVVERRVALKHTYLSWHICCRISRGANVGARRRLFSGNSL